MKSEFLGAALAASLLAALPVAAQPTPADGSCAQAIDDLGRFVSDVNALVGGQGSDAGKYGSLGSCLDGEGAASQVASLSPEKRRELAGKLLTALRDPDIAGDPQARANAVALLTELARQGLSDRGGDYYLDALVEAIETETDPVLARQATLNLDRLRGDLSADQLARVDPLVEKFLPSTPPYEALFGEDGSKTDVNWVIYGGDDTFDHGDWEEVARQKGATIKKIEPGRSLEITYTVTPDDPTGRLQPVTYHMKVLDEVAHGYSDLRVYEEMNNPDIPVIAYSYHAQYGRALRESMENAPESSGLEKIFLLGACKAKVFAHRTARLFPTASLISTIDSEYFYDMSRSQFAFMEEFANRSNWDQIQRRMNRSGAGLLNTDNYQFPNERRQLDYLDTDGDGIPDRDDTVMNYEMTSSPEVASNFSPREPAATDCTLNGERLAYAATVANGILGYSSVTSRLEDKFISAGWSEYDPDGPMFSYDKRTDANGNESWFVKTNPAYSHLDDTAMSAAMLHEFALTGLAAGNRDGQPTRDDRIAALAVGGKVMDAWSGRGYWDAFQEKFGTFDKKLSFYDVTSKIDHDNGVTSTTLRHINGILDR